MSNRVVMVGGSLLSFVDGFSPQEQQDIMDSLALAQYSADKSLKNDKLLVDWAVAGAECNTVIELKPEHHAALPWSFA